MVRKLKNSAGETITEVLVASLVVALAVLLFAMMVQSAFRIITQSEAAIQRFYKVESALETGTIKTIDGVTFEKKGGKFNSSFDLSVGNDLKNVDVSIIKAEDIIAYKLIKSGS